jgi:uncharacterized protein (TIGR03118 family)
MRFSVLTTASILSSVLPVWVSPLSAQTTANAYVRHNLVADQASSGADNVDPLLVNVWGICTSAASPFWVSDTGSGYSTLYSGKGSVTVSSTKVTIPPASSGGATTGSPTGCVIGNGSFPIQPGVNANFIFDTLDGTISAWAAGANPNQAIIKVDNSSSSAVYTGLALGGTPTNQLLYAANYHSGAIEVYDSTYKLVSMPGAFTDAMIPAGYAPFNVWPLTIAGITKLYVTYTLQDPAKKNYASTVGAGVGYVDAYDMNGVLLQRVTAKGVLNAPWGVAIAPANFGKFAGMLLVGNFGDGRINVFDPISGNPLGPLMDPSGNPIAIPGLWALIAGNGGNGGDPSAIYFAAGTGGQQHGLFGSIQAGPAINTSGVVNSASLAPGAAPNTFLSIFGPNLASTSRTWKTSDFVNGALPTQLDGVSVTIDGKPAYVAYVSPTQINVLAPSDTTIAQVPVVVTNNGLTSAPANVQLASVAPAFFLFKGNAIAAFHGDDVTPVGATGVAPGSTPAQPGETIVLWCTGFGPTNPAYPDGQLIMMPYSLPTMPTVTFGGTSAVVAYAGLTLAGVYQINVTVPATTPDGDIPVVAQIQGANSPSTAIITVQH